MKTKLFKIVLAGFGLVTTSVNAGYPLYPPVSVSSADENNAGYIAFDDSGNMELSKGCSSSRKICAKATYLPRGYGLATGSNGNKMFTQGIFFGRGPNTPTTVLYNLTLEPDSKGLSAFKENLQATIAKKYGIQTRQVHVAPAVIKNVQFLVRNPEFVSSGIEEEDEDLLEDNEDGTDDEGAEEMADAQQESIDSAVQWHFTKVMTPQWTGSLANAHNPFSISIIGNARDMEPTYQNMFTGLGQNAIVGQLSFKIPVKAQLLNVKVKCNVRDFKQQVRNLTKSWHIRKVWSGRSYKETFRNDEKNAIRKALNIKRICEIKRFEDVSLPVKAIYKARMDQIFDMLWTRTLDAIEAQNPERTREGRDDKYTRYEFKSTSEAEGTIELNLNEEVVFDASSDVEFYAGGVTKDYLYPAHNVLCHPYEVFSFAEQKCQIKCAPNQAIAIVDRESPEGRCEYYRDNL